MQNVFVVGIDSGKAGAISLLKNGKFNEVWDTPLVGKEYDIFNMRTILSNIAKHVEKTNSSLTIWMETLHAIAGIGAQSNFKMGEGYGIWLGIIGSRKWALEKVPPQKWKPVFGLTKKDKKASIMKVREMFPETAKYLQRKKDDGRADSILIATYGYRTMEHNHNRRKV